MHPDHDKIVRDRFAFSSSVSADVWHQKKSPRAYEWSYFDALSDDGSEALVIVFLDNFIFSPRYNSRKAGGRRYPAVSFTYFKDGKAVYKSVNEYPEEAFHASEDKPECSIGECSFELSEADYGCGYLVKIRARLSGDRMLEGHFEWLSIESDLAKESLSPADPAHSWNMAVPRSDVSGRITVRDRRSAEIDTHHFRGTGYHDHKRDDRWLAETVRDWHWGRAHFSDVTAVFYRYREIGDESPNTKLLIIKDGVLHERNVSYEEQNYVRDKFGLRYPTRLRLISEDNIRLRVKPVKVIDSNFYHLRFLSEFTLTMRDGVARKNMGITEFIAPRSLKYRWLIWISDIRTGKNGKGPLL